MWMVWRLLVLVWLITWSSLGHASLNTDPSDVTVTNRTDEVDLYSFALPGNLLGTGERVDLYLAGTATWNGLTQVTFRLRYGSAVLAFPVTPTQRTDVPFHVDVRLSGNGAANAQRVEFHVWAGTTAIIRSATGTMAVDSTAQQTLSFSVQYSTATTGMSIFKDVAQIETSGASSGSGGVSYFAADCFTVSATIHQQCQDTVNPGAGNLYTCTDPTVGGNSAVCDVSGDWLLNSSSSSSGVSTIFGRSGTVTATAGDYTAAQITTTPAGNLSSTTQSATNAELDSEKADAAATTSALAGKQPLNSTLTTLASKTPAGTGTNVRLSTGPFSTNDCVKVDVNGNLVTAGALCGSGSGGTPAGSTTWVQVNNAGAFGASADLSYNAARDGQFQVQANGGYAVAEIKQDGTTAAPTVGGAPALLTLSMVNQATYYALAFTNNQNTGAPKKIAAWPTNAGELELNFLSGATLTGTSFLMPDGGAYFNGVLDARGGVNFGSAPWVVMPTATTTGAGQCSYDTVLGRFRCGNGSVSQTVAPTLTHATDCTGGGVTSSVIGELCYDQDDGRLWACKTFTGGGSSTLCDSAADWQLAGGGSGLSRITSDADSEANAVQIGNATKKVKIWCDDAPNNACLIKAPSGQDMIQQLGAGRSAGYENSTGVDLFTINESTGNVKVESAGSFDAGSASAAKLPVTGYVKANTSSGNITGATTIPLADIASPTDDAVLVGNGTTYETNVLPSCSNSTTSKLLYNSSTNTFSCGTDQSSGGGSSTMKCGVIDCVAPNDSDFAWNNQGSASVDTSVSGTVILSAEISATTKYHYRSVAKPTNPFTVTVGMFIQEQDEYNLCGLGLINASTGAGQVLYQAAFPNAANYVEISNVTSFTSDVAQVVSVLMPFQQYIFFRLEVASDGGKTWEWSNNGKVYNTIGTSAASGSPDRVGVFCAGINVNYAAVAAFNYWVVN